MLPHQVKFSNKNRNKREIVISAGELVLVKVFFVIQHFNLDIENSGMSLLINQQKLEKAWREKILFCLKDF